MLALPSALVGYRAGMLTVAGIGFDPSASRGPLTSLRLEAQYIGQVPPSDTIDR